MSLTMPLCCHVTWMTLLLTHLDVVTTTSVRKTSVTRSSVTTGNNKICPKCGTFKESGRVSCCAPGGAWHKNCGAPDKGDYDHSWVEGKEACKRKFQTNRCRYMLARTM